MSRYYKVFTEINFEHDYYTDNVCGDINLQPTAETAALMPKYRLRWGALSKRNSSNYQLLREQIDPLTPLIELPITFRLRFEMVLTHPDFMNFTDISAKSNKEIFVFGNQPGGTLMAGPGMRKMELTGDTFTVTVPGPATKIVTAHFLGSGITVTADSFQQGDLWIARFNMEGKPTGVWDIGWSVGSTQVYYDPSLVGKGLFGVLHIEQRPGLAILNKYTQAFKARSAFWKYYILLKGGAAGCTYGIANGGLTFTAQLYPPGPLVADPAMDLAMQVSNITEAIRFVSTTLIPYKDVPRSLITLTRLTGTGPGIVVKNLANPALGDPNAAVIVMVDPPLP